MDENPYQPPQTEEKPRKGPPSLLMEILFRDCPPHIALLIGLAGPLAILIPLLIYRAIEWIVEELPIDLFWSGWIW